MFVRPIHGDASRAVQRDARTKRPLPAEGIEVPDFDFEALRAIARGDLEQIDAIGGEPVPKPQPKAKKAADAQAALPAPAAPEVAPSTPEPAEPAAHS